MTNSNLKRFFYQNVAQTSDAPLGINIKYAKGVYLYDDNNNAYLDCISGISVSNLGHNNELIKEAILNQINLHTHLMVYGEIVQDSQTLLANYLSEVLPSSLNSNYFVNSGSEAIEGAMKLAKRYTGRAEFVALKDAYHGSTHGALSLMSDEYFKNKFAPVLPGISFLEQNDLQNIELLITNKTAAVFLEPIMAEKGYIPCSLEFLTAIRKRCNETDTLLVFDEIQCGMGRTGKLFAFQNFDVVPDILVLAKAFGGGMPLGAFISSKEIMNCLIDNPVLGHITTFGGHPVSCAASLAAIKQLNNPKLLNTLVEKEALFRKHLKHSQIINISGIGLMLAVEFENKVHCRQIIDNCVKKGLLIDWFLYAENKIRISPPLIIESEDILKICYIILECIDEYFATIL